MVAETGQSEPVCTNCGYSLRGRTSPRCPECGVDVARIVNDDWLSLAPTPWSQRPRRWLVAGVPLVLVHPGRTLDLCRAPQLVGLTRATLFALTRSTFAVVSWPLIREAALDLCTAVQNPAQAYQRLASGLSYGKLTDVSYSARLWSWEAWSLTRWWVFFGALAAFGLPSLKPALGARSRGVEVLCRILLFAPWLVALDLGYLVGVWFADPHVVPEPSTLFHPSSLEETLRGWMTNRYLATTWWVRGSVPTAAVGYLFLRFVLGFHRPRALIGALALIPLGIVYSLCSSVLYLNVVLR